MAKIKVLLKAITPPIIISAIQLFKKPNKTQEQWAGNYNTWAEAQLECTGYDSKIILEKCKNAILKVKNGEAVYERDSVLFDKISYSWPLLAFLLSVGLEQKGKLHLIDFGGSLGSTYYQNKDFLSILPDLRWNIVEQKHFVEIGRNLFEDEHLKFHNTINDCLINDKCSVILFSSVLQYLETPISFIETVIQLNFDYIIFDRTSFVKSEQHIITVQKVPEEIYSASYPCWFFNEKKLMDVLNSKYKLFHTFDALDTSNYKDSYFKGFIFKRN